jgi:hypothetical protein
MVNELCRSPTSGLGISAQLLELVLDVLVESADPSVNGSLHGNTAFTFAVIRSPSQSMP